MSKEYTCVVCPMSCRVTVIEKPDGTFETTGNTCPRGARHAIAEHTRPMRMLTSTVILDDGKLPRIPVISDTEVPKDMLQQCLDELYKVHVTAPVTSGQVIVENICGTGANIVAARSMKKA